MNTCHNIPEKSSTTKINKHRVSGYSMFTHCSIDTTKNKVDCYRGKYCMERFCKGLKERVLKIINYDDKEIIPLTYEENEFYKKQEYCYICKKEFNTDKNDKKVFKLRHKVKNHCHYTGKYRRTAHNICNLRYKTPKEIPVVFHKSSTYNYHFIISELANEFDGELECLGENKEKYITFSVLLSSLVNNLSEIYSKMCRGCRERKIIESVCDFTGLKICDRDIKKFILLLRKGVYPYEYMDSWERFDKTVFPNKKEFYSKLNLEDITDLNYRHDMQREYIKNLIIKI